MGILLAFAPFIAFAVFDGVLGSVAGLAAGALISLALVGRDALTPGRTPKILEIGTALLFCALLLYAWVAHPTWSVIAVRFCVDAGLLAIVLVSIALGRPFTLQYARERVAPELHGSPVFLRTNYIIAGAWALAFAVMAGTEAALLFVPDTPRRLGVAVIVAALVAAFKFTGWYPEQVRRRAGA